MVSYGTSWEDSLPGGKVRPFRSRWVGRWHSATRWLDCPGKQPVSSQVSDDHAGLKRALAEVLPEAALTDHFGPVGDFLSSCWNHLRPQSRPPKLQGRIQFGGALSGRDINAVQKTMRSPKDQSLMPGEDRRRDDRNDHQQHNPKQDPHNDGRLVFDVRRLADDLLIFWRKYRGPFFRTYEVEDVRIDDRPEGKSQKADAGENPCGNPRPPSEATESVAHPDIGPGQDEKENDYGD